VPCSRHPEVAGAGYARLRAAGIAVDVGLGAEEARRDHAGHIHRMRDGRPHVLLKLAASADGKAGAAGRKPVAITGERARERVHLLRAHCDAITVGIGTALAGSCPPAAPARVAPLSPKASTRPNANLTSQRIVALLLSSPLLRAGRRRAGEAEPG
jgi:hypothetical protein